MPTRHRVTAVGHMGRSVASCEGLDPIGWTNRAEFSRQSAVGQTVQPPGDGRGHEAIRRAVSLSRCLAVSLSRCLAVSLSRNAYPCVAIYSHASRQPSLEGAWVSDGYRASGP
jgi:hypothetical protein